MFLLLINKLNEIAQTDKLSNYISETTQTTLPHETILAETGQISLSDLNLSSLMAAAGFSAETLASDDARRCLLNLSGQQFLHLGFCYRKKIKSILNELDQNSEFNTKHTKTLQELHALYDTLVAYEKPAKITSEQLLKHHLLTGIVEVVNPKKAENQQLWPNERNLNTIEKLYKTSFHHMINTLPEGARVLDIGSGRGVLLKDLIRFNFGGQTSQSPTRKPLRCYGITTTTVDGSNLSGIKELTYAALPHCKSWSERHFNFFDLAFDTYAALTYSDNPLHSLICIILAMAPNGRLYSMSSLTPGDTENSCFGNTNTRNAIRAFFQNHMGIDITFDLIPIESKACKPGEMMDDLRISVKIPANGLQLSSHIPANQTSWNLFKSLCQLADNEIGIPTLMENKTAFQAGNYHITMRDYQRPNTATLSAHQTLLRS